MLLRGNTAAMSAVILKAGENHDQRFSFGESFEVFKLNGRGLLRPISA
jgi:hypothetical protein